MHGRLVAAQRADGAKRGSVRGEAEDMLVSDLVALAEEKVLDEFLNQFEAGASIIYFGQGQGIEPLDHQHFHVRND